MAVPAVTFTVLPWGRVEAGLLAGVLVSPRLPGDDDPGTILAQYPDFSPWPPPRLRLSGLQVSNGGFLPKVTATQVRDTGLWSQLLPPQTPVAPYDMTALPAPFLSYPAGSIADFLRAQWRAFGRGAARPTVVDLLDDAAFGVLAETWEAGTQEPESLFARARRPPHLDDLELRGVAPSALDLLRFLQPYATPGPDGEVPDIAAPLLDFHAVLGILTSHPWLLERLGLLWRLVVEPAVDLSDGAEVRLVINWEPADPTLRVVRPWTAVTAGSTGFTAAASDEESALPSGLLPVHDTARWQVETVDVDTAGLQIVQLAQSLRRQLAHPDPGMPTTTGLPALRSAGITLRRVDNAEHVAAVHTAVLKRNDQLAAALGAEPGDGEDADLGDGLHFTAEDLFRGVRVDVCDAATGVWRSLTARRGTLRVPPDGPPQAAGEDEGATVTAVASDPAGEAAPRLSETVAHWDGWSLVAGRPGAPLPVDDSGDAAGPPLPAAIEYVVPPGSLPRLRYGRTYHLRARTVDVGGGGLTLADADTLLPFDRSGPVVKEGMTAPVQVGRFEPVPPPVVFTVAPFQPGDAVERLVARTDPASSRSEAAERVVAAAGVAQLTAERHGAFDVSAEELAALYAAFTEAPVPPPPGSTKADLVNATTWRSSTLDLPWSPDPMASAATLIRAPGEPVGDEVFADLGLAGEAAPIAAAPFGVGDPWPHAQAFRLRVSAVPEDAPPHVEWLPRERTLLVQMPWAARARVRLACALPNERALDSFGIWQWMDDVGPEDRKRARAGLWWVLTPYRTLELVSAISSPLRPAWLTDPVDDTVAPYLVAERAAAVGSVHAEVTGKVSVDAKSTGSVDIVARWEEWVDDGVTPPSVRTDPATRPVTSAQVLRLDVPDGPQLGAERTLVSLPPTRHVFGDTRARAVAYGGVAASRFADCFPAAGEPGGSIAVTTPPEAESLARLPSTARPKAPSVQLVVPYFTWTTVQEDELTQRRVRGGGLRVWLDRPWWSSGAFERLAVIYTSPQVDDEVDERIRPYVTTWAPDPAHPWPRETHTLSLPGGGPVDLPRPAAGLPSFPRAVSVVTGLHLDEAHEHGLTVVVAAHDVDWDPERGAWYADVEIRDPRAVPDAPATQPYAPFVRLALARHQPSSLPGVELSAVTVLAPVQLPLDRTATIARDDSTVAVAITGPGAGLLDGSAQMGVEVANSVGGVVPDELAWRPLGELVPMAGGYSLPSGTVPGGILVEGWHGSIELPSIGAGKLRRLVLREYEELTPDPALPDGPSRRLIYADSVVLP